MHQLTWLHLSDIHFHPALNWRDAHSHETLLKYLEQCFSEDPSLRPDLIFCTGDIAFGETHKAPLAEQYTDAISFFEKLLIACGSDGVALAKNRLFVVPGNHDVNRKSINSDAQESLYKKTEQSEKYVSAINQRFNDRQIEFQQSMERLKEYADFVKAFLPHQHDADNRVRYAQAIQVNNIKVGIAGLNSAWSCAGDEDDRKLWLAAEWQLNKAREQLHEADIRIALMHHPIDNLNQNERDLTTHRFADEFHFLLHGHSHNMWVTPSAYITLAAGAVGAASKDEFGINIVRLDFEVCKGNVYLHKYDKTGWTIAPVPKHAPKGIWQIDLPKSISSIPASTTSLPLEEEFSPPPPPPPANIKLYGRNLLLNEASAKLQQNCLLLVYGMRGNGKTRVIEALATRAPLAGKEAVRIQVDRDTSASSLFRQFAHMLGDNSDVPRPPSGTVEAVAHELRKRYPAPRPSWLWLDRAHLLLKSNGFEKPEVRTLLMALNMAFGVQLPIILELREHPPIALLGRNCNEIEVPGLDKNSLAECLADAAPPTRTAEWHYKGDQLKRVYGWLGGGGGKQAHPLAITLLIEVAKGHDETPIEVLYRHSGDVRQKLEDALLGDLINDVLSENERYLIQVLSLYRNAIPYDQVDELEQQLDLIGSWDGIIRRCLLAPNSNGSLYYLHGFTTGWLRATLGYDNGDDGILDEFRDDASVIQRIHAERLHRAIAKCWLEQLGSGKRRTMLDVERAVEAFFHLTAAGDGDNVSAVAVDLLSGNEEWALRRIKTLYEYLYRNSAPVQEQRKVLEYWTILDPNEAKAQRFLGECWIKEEGKTSTKALACFENACRLMPDFPQYWTNLGRSLLAQGEDGARDFLKRLEKLELSCPQAINDFARSVQAHCLTRIGESEAASTLRMRMIAQGSRDPVFYNDEAQARLEANNEKGAIEILALAAQRGCTDDFTDAIHANALQKSGDFRAATVLRMKKIEAHSCNPVFYADEAKVRLEAGDLTGALEVLDLASQRGCANEFTEAVRSNVLRHLRLISCPN